MMGQAHFTKSKKRIGQVLVSSVLNYGREVDINHISKEKINSSQTEYLREVQRFLNWTEYTVKNLRNKMKVREESKERQIMERVKKKSLKWFGYLFKLG